MTATGEIEKKDISVCTDYETCLTECGLEIGFWLETWFSVNEKFGIDINENDDAWVDVYCRYAPDDDDLSIEYGIDRPWEPMEWHEYIPTEAEKKAIVSDLADTIKELDHMDFQEFCRKEKEEWERL